jgi:hypothetical protein
VTRRPRQWPRRVSDGSNYLGGIGDVLENKTNRGVHVEHLGAPAAVSVYENDRQIIDWTYRRRHGNRDYSTVRIHAV